METPVEERNVGEVIVGIAVFVIFILLVMSMIGPLAVVALVLIGVYGIYQLVRYLHRKIERKVEESKYDSEGRRITKASVLDMKESASPDNDNKDGVR